MTPFLRGVRVLDLGRLMPSAIATAELARLGADVVKVEIPPDGDYLRTTPPLVAGRGDMHLQINRGKRSLALRFDTDEGRAVLLRMVRDSQVFVELSRPGTMEKLGLGAVALLEVNPAVVYCSFSGFGQDGPYSKLAAHGLSADVASGFLPLEEADGRTAIPASYTSIGPRASGLYGAVSILGALLHSRATGEGCSIDISQWDATVAWHYRGVVLEANGGERVPAYRDLGPRYDIYRCSDGRHVLFAAPERKLWARFCEAVDRPDLITPGEDLVDYHDDPALRREVAGILAGRDRTAWVEFGVETGVPISPCLDTGEIDDDPHYRERSMLLRERHPLGGDVWVTGDPAKFNVGPPTEAGPAAGPPVELSPAPELGQHSWQVLADFGFDDAEIERLRKEGTVE
jgi:crotonobetainyl-CoA:carnitine CoA-transferase CaiB-like acyl-CoA transferase